MALAARKIPSLLYVPDIEPGMALKFLAGYAKIIALTTEQSRKFFKDSSKLVVTGYPTRSNLTTWNRQSARTQLNLHNQLPVILFLGGSKGARSINNALLEILPQLLEKAQVIHITGQLDWNTINDERSKLSSSNITNYHAFPYLHENMGAALQAADLVVSRAGASTLGEYPLFSLPALLVPYPHAWRYQKINADYLSNHQAAVTVPDEELPSKLLPAIFSILENPDKLSTMKLAMANLARPNAAANIANLVIELGTPAFQEGTGV
jgi:UDP-N-acetylglucosamine--N-acetylmuramyl-(pentapeptide) pyrophosphoryl-undecaprenol N-acetylglucosamine transferase